MSKKNKKHRVRPPELKPNCSEQDVIKYIMYLFTRFSGYSCISVSKPSGTDNMVVPITAHKAIPSLDQVSGCYQSVKDHVIEYIELTRSDFEGFIIDRNGTVCIGDPFGSVPKPIEDNTKLDLEHAEEEQL